MSNKNHIEYLKKTRHAKKGIARLYTQKNFAMYLQHCHHVICRVQLPCELALTVSSLDTQTRRQTLVNIKLVGNEFLNRVWLMALANIPLPGTLRGSRGKRL